jgi:hypothetical protein
MGRLGHTASPYIVGIKILSEERDPLDRVERATPPSAIIPILRLSGEAHSFTLEAFTLAAVAAITVIIERTRHL